MSELDIYKGIVKKLRQEELMTKTELRKSLDFVSKEREKLLDKVEYYEDILHKITASDGETTTPVLDLIEENNNYKTELQEVNDNVTWWHNRFNNLRKRIDEAIEYLEEPNRDNFDYSKARLIEILRGK